MSQVAVELHCSNGRDKLTHGRTIIQECEDALERKNMRKIKYTNCPVHLFTFYAYLQKIDKEGNGMIKFHLLVIQRQAK